MPPTRPLRLLQAAADEARIARLWYAGRSDAAAEGFAADLDHAFEKIEAAPERWAPHVHGTRRYVLRRFPYVVVYRIGSETVDVVAVSHQHRRPGYWRTR